MHSNLHSHDTANLDSPTLRSVESIKLPNGLTIIYENPETNIDITSIYCFCKLGSINEDDSTRGASHFIEHMCFQGTKKFKKPEQISHIYDKYGAYFNAFTENEQTCYTIKCPDEYLYPCIDVLSELMFYSTFSKNEYKKELQVVIQESVNSSENYESI